IRLELGIEPVDADQSRRRRLELDGARQAQSFGRVAVAIIAGDARSKELEAVLRAGRQSRGGVEAAIVGATLPADGRRALLEDAAFTVGGGEEDSELLVCRVPCEKAR